jgi:hypothetical protein
VAAVLVLAAIVVGIKVITPKPAPPGGFTNPDGNQAANLAPIQPAAPSNPSPIIQSKTITVLMLDGKSGKPIVPSNFIARLDHLDAVHNELLQLSRSGTGAITIPAGATFLSIQGTYNRSTDIYINCDSGMEKDTHALHWYSVPDILSTGVAAPNECYKGKYAEATHMDPKPGQFVLFVRELNWQDASTN